MLGKEIFITVVHVHRLVELLKQFVI